MSDVKIVGLDIGTNVLRVAIGIIDSETGEIQIVGTASSKSKGLRNGVIVNLEEAKTAICDVIEKAEQNAGFTIESVFTAIGGTYIESFNSRGVAAVKTMGKQNHEISQSDVADAIGSAVAVKVPEDRKQLHVITQNYIVDGIDRITDPIHRIGTRLEVEVHIVTVSKTIIQNLRLCICDKANYGLNGVFLKTLAQTQAVCYDDELELGSILIDLGAASTDIIVLIHGAPISTASVPIGGNLVTNDISQVLKIPTPAAEEIKIKSGCCWIDGITPKTDEDVIIPGIGGRAPEAIRKSQLCEIIQARMYQLFKNVKVAILKNTNDSLKQLSGNVILTGGGAMMEGIVELAQNVFKTSSVRLGIPENLGGIEDEYRRPDFATAIGLIVANKQYATSKESRKRGRSAGGKRHDGENKENILKKIFKSLF